MKSYDLIIVGSGLAGSYAALVAHQAGARVLLVSKTALRSGSTARAQGGIAFPLNSLDLKNHLADTLAAGRGLSEVAASEAILAEGLEHLRTLEAWGFAFDPGLAREGGHSQARVRHAGGDATGGVLLSWLLSRLEAEGVEFLERTPVAALLGEGEVFGVQLGPDQILPARAVILATGGFGQLFPHTTNPPESTGDGIALAYRAGAAIRDLELFQFHPTVLPNGGLISEAARGEGAILLNAQGERFMFRYDPAGEMAPRDVVSRSVQAEISRTGAVFLDLRPIKDFAHHFPTGYALARELGYDPGLEPVPVIPGAHYAMGGIQTGAYGETTLPGLFAAGEVASTGLQGANRLASNSLLEALVMGSRAARAALASQVEPKTGQFQPAPGLNIEFKDQIRSKATQALGLLRNGLDLSQALAWVRSLELSAARSADELEVANLATVFELALQGALTREESRGAHYRSDFPASYPEPYHVVQKQGQVPERVVLAQAVVG